MKRFDFVHRFFIRWRYPVSMPEDVAGALGISLSNYLSFPEFVNLLTSPGCCPSRLMKYMPRHQAEDAFRNALRKEKFSHLTLFSYYFNEGWMEFVLQFDEQSRLRRIYLQHKDISQDTGIEIHLQKAENLFVQR